MIRPARPKSSARTRPPRFLEPMLATLTVASAFDPARDQATQWVVERKLDGFRALALKSGAEVQLLSRNRLSLAEKFPEVVEALRQQPLDSFVIDGEIVAMAGAQASFGRLQQRLKPVSLAHARRSGVRIEYIVFDLLEAQRHDLRRLPLLERKRLLKQAIRFNRRVRFLPHFRPAQMTVRRACDQGWEGLIAKDAQAPYIAGRSRRWLKLKCDLRQEFVIGGYTDPAGSRTGFGALLIGYYEGRILRYAGKVGTGYSASTLTSLSRTLKTLAVDAAPFAPDPQLPRRNVHWCRPKLVAEIVFSEWTSDGKLRHPRFLGLRADKRATEVGRERPVAPPKT